MKKSILLIASLLIISINSFSQLTITEYRDEMSEESFFATNETPVYFVTSEKKVGFKLDAFITRQDSTHKVSGVFATHAGLGSCNEKDVLIILFVDGSKISVNSTKDFNCKGNATFMLNDEERESLATKDIKKIRITNKYTYKEATATPTTDLQKNYFKDISELIKKGNFPVKPL